MIISIYLKKKKILKKKKRSLDKIFKFFAYY